MVGLFVRAGLGLCWSWVGPTVLWRDMTRIVETGGPLRQPRVRALLAWRRQPRTLRVYDRAASTYAFWRRTWLRQAGAAAEANMLVDLAATLKPGDRVLDAGSGTGALSRHIKLICPTSQLTRVDLSPAMLSQAEDVRATKVVTDVQRLPFRDECFDVVVSSWVIETVADPRQAVSEYLRVLAQDGQVLYTFCTRPESPMARLRTLLLRAVVRVGFAGHFLQTDRTPWHDCANSHRAGFDGGLTTEIVLAKCCNVDSAVLPRPGTKLRTEFAS